MNEAAENSAVATAKVKRKPASHEQRAHKAECDIEYRVAKAAEIKEYKRRWHLANKERMNAKSMERYLSNHDEEKAKRRAYYRNKPKEQKEAEAREFYLRNKEKIDARARAYAEANRDKVLESKRANYRRNRDAMKAKEKLRNSDPVRRERNRQRAMEWHHDPKNREHRIQTKRAYTQSHREEINAKKLAYGKTPKGRLSKLNIKHKRRSKVKAGNVTTAELAAMKKLAKGRCYYCRKKRPLTLDHIIPLGAVGTHTKDNIIFACGECNSSKGAKDANQWARERHGLLIV